MNELDKDSDGTVSFEELLAVVTASGGEPTQAEQIWARLDANQDGSITMNEMADAFKIRIPLIGRHRFGLLIESSKVML